MADGTGANKQIVIGERLRAAREQRSITLEEASARTKIQIAVLQALESGEMVQRLGAFYARGFLKKYGQFLDVDVQPWLDDLAAQRPSRGPILAPSTQAAVSPPSQPASAPLLRQEPSRWNLPWEVDWEKLRQLVLAVSGGIAAFVFVVWGLQASVNAWRSAQARRPAVPITATVERRAEAAVPSEKAKTASLVKTGAPLTLTVLPKRDVWMRVRADGKTVFQNVLTVGTAERWRAAEQFELWVGDADALTLDLNGHDLGAPGRGVQKNIVITHEGMQVKR